MPMMLLQLDLGKDLIPVHIIHQANEAAKDFQQAWVMPIAG